MQEGRDTSHFGFLYRIISIHPLYLKPWFDSDEFVDGLLEIEAKGSRFNNHSVYALMKSVYDQKMMDRANGHNDPTFNFYQARRSIHAMEKVLGTQRS